MRMAACRMKHHGNERSSRRDVAISGRIHGLASVDAYDGDSSAREASEPSAIWIARSLRRLRARIS
jgi:hypothetical protein